MSLLTNERIFLLIKTQLIFVSTQPRLVSLTRLRFNLTHSNMDWF